MKYNIVDVDGGYWIELLEEPFEGIRYSYGKVEFVEPKTEDGDATLKFDYSVYDQRLVLQLENDIQFHKVIGDILVGLIEKQLATNEIVYTGGTDEG